MLSFYNRHLSHSLVLRHLCEFTGLDLEMAINDHYMETLEVIHTMFKHIVALNTYTEPFLSLRAHEQRELIESNLIEWYLAQHNPSKIAVPLQPLHHR